MTLPNLSFFSCSPSSHLGTCLVSGAGRDVFRTLQPFLSAPGVVIRFNGEAGPSPLPPQQKKKKKKKKKK